MYLQTILVAALSSGVVGLVVGYFLNRRFEREKAQLQETIRRQAEVFDQQKAALLEISEMAYRLRNELRDAVVPLPELSRSALRRISEAQRAFSESLYSSRALLPQLIFEMAHEIKTPSLEASILLDRFREHKAAGRELPPKEVEALSHALQRIEAIFHGFVEATRQHVGVNGGAPNPGPAADR